MATLPIQPILPQINTGYPLKITYTEKNSTIIGHYFPQANVIGIQWDSPVLPNPTPVYYIGPRIVNLFNSVVQLFGKSELAGNKKDLIEAVQKLNETINDISTIMLHNSVYFYTIQNNGLHLPLSAMGDGINRLFMILCCMIATPGCIVLVYEIENGFHYSFYSKLWQIIADTSVKTKCQIFATTHSYECIQGAYDYIKKENQKIENISYIRLGKLQKEVVPHIFSTESFIFAIENNMEIR
jgi:AAA15 family ATPase/GTPase